MKMANKPFKLDQQQLWIKFNNQNPTSQEMQLKKDLKNYFEISSRRSQSDDLKYLLSIGLKVVNGQYHDEKLNQIANQIKNLNLTIQDEVATNNAIIQGIGDLQDAFTGQQSDIDALITPETQRTRNRRLNKK